MLKKELTQGRILEAFWNLYETTEFHKISVTGVCKAAGINRSTFYEYFVDIYQLLDTAENSIFPPKEIAPFFDSSKKQTYFDIEKNLILIQEQKHHLSILFTNENNRFRSKFIDYIRPIVSSLMTKEEIDKNSIYAMEYTLWGILGAFECHIKTCDDNPSEDKFLKILIQLVEKTHY
ncbi:MAG: TetR/AcrR family transcriptional regulator [Eubacteriales bacterium]